MAPVALEVSNCTGLRSNTLPGALAVEIPGAQLLELPQTGHEIPERTWDLLVPAIQEHTGPR